MDYNFDFNIQYNTIEQDLLENIKNGEREYNVDEVKLMCEYLYRVELLNIFNLDNINDIDDVEHSNTMHDLWDIFKDQQDVEDILKCYQACLTGTYCMSHNEKYFYTLFNFELLPFTHECISSFFKSFFKSGNGKIDIPAKIRLIEQIKLISI